MSVTIKDKTDLPEARKLGRAGGLPVVVGRERADNPLSIEGVGTGARDSEIQHGHLND